MKKISSLLVMLFLFAILTLSAYATAPSRPIVENNTLKTSSHELIRSTVQWYAKCNTIANNRALDANQWKRSKEFGLNTMRLTNWDEKAIRQGDEIWTIEENIAFLDQLINIADENGMYVIITPGDIPGYYNKTYLTDFWTVAAPHYKDRTNVIFEVNNEPVEWDATDYFDNNDTVNELAAIYKIIREGAPDTPILSLCVASANKSMLNLVKTYRNKTGINFSEGKDLISFHTYGTTDDGNVASLRNNYPCINTEWGVPFRSAVQKINNYSYHGQMLEKLKIGWENFWMTRDDGQFAKFSYGFIDDAKAKGYYWVNPDAVITDTMNSYAMISSHSSNLTFDTANASTYYDGDASRITRTNTSAGYIVYNIAGALNGIGAMKAHMFYSGQDDGIKFYSSKDGTSWLQLSTTKSTPKATSGNWHHAFYSLAQAIPVNTQYLKIQISSSRGSNVTQIGEVSFDSYDLNHYGGVDNLNSWNMINSRSTNMVFTSEGNEKASFDSDPNRVIRNNSSAGFLTYKVYPTIYDGFYLTTFIKGSSTGVLLYSSSDATNWTLINESNLTLKDALQDDEIWTKRDYTMDYTLNPLPAGTQYVKVEIPTISGMANTQIGSFTWWKKYDYSNGPLYTSTPPAVPTASPTPTPIVTPTVTPTPTPTPSVVFVNDSDSMIIYGGSGWTQIERAESYGGNISFSTTLNDYVEYTFTGTGIKLYTQKGPGGGKFDIYVDGENMATFDSYASSQKNQVLAYDDQMLTSGQHTIKLVVTHTKNINSNNYTCHLDYICVTTYSEPVPTPTITPTPTPELTEVIVDDSDAAITYSGSWSHIARDESYGGDLSYSTTLNDYAEYNFIGTGIQLYIQKGAAGGKFDIYLDDIKVVSAYDSYAGSQQNQVLAYDNQSLTLGSHTLKVVVLHTKNANSSNYYLNYDYLVYTN